MIKCWECETETDDIHHHHVVPRSRGGKKTVPLCLDCHGKAHHRKDSMTTSVLTKEGQESKRNRSKKDGTWAGGHPPKGFTVDHKGFLIPNEDFHLVVKACHLRLEGLSLRKIGKQLGAHKTSVSNWTKPWMDQPEKLFAYLKDDTKEKQ